MMERKKWFCACCIICLLTAAVMTVPMFDSKGVEVQDAEKVNLQSEDSTEMTQTTQGMRDTEEKIVEVLAEEAKIADEAEVTEIPMAQPENTEEMKSASLDTEHIWAAAYHSVIFQAGLTNDNLVLMALAEAESRELELLAISGDHIVTYQGERFTISDDDYQVLLRIVESEAPEEDIKGKMLVANVVLNRVLSDWFPNTITEVVFEKKQFAPISDGNYWRVNVSESTVEAVERVLKGEDESEGALFFMARALANPKNVKWFDDSLEFLFKHGVHEFFKAKSK